MWPSPEGRKEPRQKEKEALGLKFDFEKSTKTKKIEYEI